VKVTAIHYLDSNNGRASILMKRTAYGIFLLPFCITTIVSCAGSVETVPTEPVAIPELGKLELPQIAATPDGGLLMAWTVRREGGFFEGFDLFVSTTQDNAFSDPVQVNAADVPLHSIPIDEMRPAVAFGPDGKVALAWTDDFFDIRVATSSDGGKSFTPSVRLNQDEGDALQEFPDIAYGPDGVLHAVWLDPRIAEEGLEEPADLYYARIVDGVVTERNLTESQESSACGCCLPNIIVEPDGSLTVVFRNTTPSGYRDPFRVVATPDGQFTEPSPVSPPIWQIEACPIAGPIAVDEMTLWFDGSTGQKRLLLAWDPNQMPDVVLEDSDGRFLDYPPRKVSGTPAQTTMLLVPAQPTGYLLNREGRTWTVIADDLPSWATSAVFHEGRLYLVGTDVGAFQSEIRNFEIVE
jgi:hypothetical protein